MQKKHDKKTGLTVLMSIYQKDEPQWLEEAIASIINQTRQPDEIVLVKDGPLTSQMDSVIEKWTKKYSHLFKIVALKKNSGLGLALTAGLEKCSFEIVARMDADDISMPDRFQKQCDFLSDHPDISMVCSRAGQFETGSDEIMFSRGAPTEHKKIVRLARFRNPIDHGTVMYRRSEVLEVGGYCNMKSFEDYHLWGRMIANGSQIACIPEVLYKFRRSRDMLSRRRGLCYLQRWMTLQKEFLKIGFVSLPIFIVNIIIRTTWHLMPLGLLRRTRKLLKF